MSFNNSVHLLLREVLQVLLKVGFRRSQVPDEELGTWKTNLQQPYKSVAEKERKLLLIPCIQQVTLAVTIHEMSHTNQTYS